ncbi:MAG: HDOD domain-containing protein [Nitrospirae bacterium]|nr:HDOD domain-containing protein [Nitrospirota bacterium]MBF0535309.1 HDOD domain-containing protein [Nitrospirota bacterium]MBF0617268.1 HDOD domain-containing protein [Nitrospirota bacterium]
MEDSQKQMFEMVESMPAFPKSVHRIIELTSNINSNPKELVEVIEHDPVLILNILKLVNSASFGLSQKITSINHAVVYIGLNTVKNLALITSTLGVLPRRNHAGFDIDKFLLHCLSVATISKLLAKRSGVADNVIFDYFLAGMLHDIGKIVFAQYLPDKFKLALAMAKEEKVTLYNAEQKVIGYDHAYIGSMLAEKWKLPSSLVDCISRHHSVTEEESKGSEFIDYVFLANQITKQLGIGFAGEILLDTIPKRIFDRFGTDLPAIITSFENLDSEIEKAQLFIKT